MKNGFVEKIYHIIETLEKDRFTLLPLFAWIFIITFTRLITEAYLFDYSYKTLAYEHIFTITHLIIFGYATGLGAVLLLKLFTKENIKKIINIGAIGGSIAILPQLIDYFIFQRTDVYRYLPIQNVLDIFTPTTSEITSFGGIGLFLELILVLFFTSFYVFLKQYKKQKSKVSIIALPIINFFVFFGFLLLMTIPTLNPLVRLASIGSYGKLTQPFLVVYYLTIGLIFLLLITYVEQKKLISEMFQFIRQKLIIFSFVLVSLGILISNNFQINLFSLFQPAELGNISTFLISLYTVFFAIQLFSFTHYSHNKDKFVYLNKYLDDRRKNKLSIIFGIIILTLAYTLSLEILIISIIFLLVISIKYLFNKKSLLQAIRSVQIALMSSLFYLIGFFTPSYMVFSNKPPFEPVRNSSMLTMQSLLIAVIIFIIVALVTYFFFNNKKNEEGFKKRQD